MIDICKHRESTNRYGQLGEVAEILTLPSAFTTTRRLLPVPRESQSRRVSLLPKL